MKSVKELFQVVSSDPDEKRDAINAIAEVQKALECNETQSPGLQRGKFILAELIQKLNGGNT